SRAGRDTEGSITMRARLLARGVVTVTALWALGLLALAQAPVRGTITGTVTSAEGKVIGLRVAAHNLDQRLWYIVFTNKGQYRIPQALPGRYEITVNEPGFGSPKESVQLRPGGTQTVDFSLDKLPDDPRPAVITGNMGGAAGDGMEGGGNGRPATPRKIQFFNTLEEIYPPGPGRDLVKANCTGCHADDLTTYHYTQ